MVKPTKEELRRRLKTGQYLIKPEKPTSQMTQREALEWEKACLEARLSITEDEKRKPGLMLRIQDIEYEFLKEKAEEASHRILTQQDPYENEVDVGDVDEEEESFDIDPEDEPDEEEVEPDDEEVEYEEVEDTSETDNTSDVDQMIEEINNDPMFD